MMGGGCEGVCLAGMGVQKEARETMVMLKALPTAVNAELVEALLD